MGGLRLRASLAETMKGPLEIGKRYPYYGTVVAIMSLGGERYYMFIKDRVVSLMPSISVHA